MPRWSEGAREKQRLLIQQQKPWIRSTGPRSEFGKRMSSRNSRKDTRRCHEIDTGVTPENRISALDVAVQQEDDIRLGDRVKYIGSDSMIQALLGGAILSVVRVVPTIACATQDGRLILEFRREELCNAQMDT